MNLDAMDINREHLDVLHCFKLFFIHFLVGNVEL